MRASGIIAVVGGAGALALLGIALLVRSAPTEDSGPSPGDGPGSSSRSATPQAGEPRPSATSPRAPSNTREPRGVAPPPSSSASVQPEAPEAAERPPASAETPASAKEEEMLELSRRGLKEEDRLEALRWLAQHAEPRHFEALQDLQINGSTPAVRTAAEEALNALRVRHAKSQWPGVEPTDPQSYMRDAPSPPP